jgi:hypothetical protein
MSSPPTSPARASPDGDPPAQHAAKMAEDVAALCRQRRLGARPDRRPFRRRRPGPRTQREPLRPRGVVGINPALGTFEGIAGWLFPMMAKLLSMNPFVPLFFSRMAASEKRIGELLASTGSRIDAQGIALYRRLASDRGHIDGTLAMMAQWDVEMLAERLPFLDMPSLFLVGEATAPCRHASPATPPPGCSGPTPGLGGQGAPAPRRGGGGRRRGDRRPSSRRFRHARN